MLMLSGKYLLFYLLQGRLFNGTLHRLLLDGWYILENGNPPVSHMDTIASSSEVKMTQDISEFLSHQ